MGHFYTIKPIFPTFLATYAVFFGAIAAQLHPQAHHSRDLHTFLATLFTISCSGTPRILLLQIFTSIHHIILSLQSQPASSKSLSTFPGTISILAAVSRVESSFQILPVRSSQSLNVLNNSSNPQKTLLATLICSSVMQHSQSLSSSLAILSKHPNDHLMRLRLSPPSSPSSCATGFVTQADEHPPNEK